MRQLTPRELEFVLRDVIPYYHHVVDQTNDIDDEMSLYIRPFLYKLRGVTSANRETSEEYYNEAHKIFDHYRQFFGNMSRAITRLTISMIADHLYPNQ